MSKKILKVTIIVVLIIITILLVDRIYWLNNYPEGMLLKINILYPEKLEIMDRSREYESFGQLSLAFNGKNAIGEDVLYFFDKLSGAHIAINKQDTDYATLDIVANPILCSESFENWGVCRYEDRAIDNTIVNIFENDKLVAKNTRNLEYTFQFVSKKEQAFRIKSSWCPHWLLPWRRTIFDERTTIHWLDSNEFENLKTKVIDQ